MRNPLLYRKNGSSKRMRVQTECEMLAVQAMEEMRNETARETEYAKAIKVAKGMLQS